MYSRQNPSYSNHSIYYSSSKKEKGQADLLLPSWAARYSYLWLRHSVLTSVASGYLCIVKEEHMK